MLSFPNPIIKILTSKELVGVQVDSKSSNLFSIQQKNPFPSLNQKEILEIYSQNDKNNIYANIIKEIGFNFVFYENDLNFLKKAKPKNEEELNFLIKYVLYSYIAWYAYVEKTETASFSDIILESLNHVMELCQNDVIKHAFLYSVVAALPVSDLIETTAIMNQMSIFFKNLSCIESEYYEIFVIMGEILIDNKKTDYFGFIPFMNNLFSTRELDFPAETADSLHICLKNHLINAGGDSLRLFGYLMNSINETEKMSTIDDISKVFLSFLSGFDYKIEENKEPLPFTEFQCSGNTTLNFSVIETYKNGFSLPKTDLSGVVVKDFGNIFDEKINEKINLINEISKESKDFVRELVDSIIKMMDNCKDEGFNQIVTLFLLDICYKNESCMPLISSFLVHSFLFQKQFFNEELYKYRYIAYQMIFLDDVAFLDLTDFLFKSPLQFIEFVRLCSAREDWILSFMTQSRNVSKAVSKGLTILQSINAEEGSVIEEVRAEALSYVLDILSDTKIMNHFLSDATFAVSWVYSAYEIPIRNVVLKSISDYLLKTNKFNQTILMQSIINIFTLGNLQISSDETVVYLNDILKLLNNIMHKRPQYKETMSDLVSTLISTIEILIPTEKCRELLVTVINFFSNILSTFQLSSYNMQSITAAIETINKEPSVPVKNALLDFLVGQNSTDKRKSMIIQQAKTAGVLLKIYKNTEYIIEIIEKLIDLCMYSQSNCVKMHNDEIDLLVLDVIIEHWDMDDEVSTEKISKLFDLFIIINKVASSSVVVFRFISLFCPFEGVYMSSHFPKAINILKDMLKLHLSLPSTYVEITTRTQISPLSLISTKEGITALMWVKKDERSNQYTSKIITIESAENKLSLILGFEAVSIITTESDGMSKIREVERAQSGKWTLISFSLKGKDEESSTVTVDLGNGPHVIDIGLTFNDSSKFTFCGMFEDDPDPEFPNFLGPFAIYPLLTEEQIEILKDKGYRYSDSYDIQPLYSIQKFSNNVPPTSTFSTIFLNICKVDSILPLLNYSLIRYKSGKQIENVIMDFLDILTLSVRSGGNVEKNFVESNGFALIYHILSRQTSIELTYDIYLKFYTILQISELNEFKKQLISNIIFNMKFWSVCDVDTQEKILSHWVNSLFPLYSSYIMEITTFTDIFAAMINTFTTYGENANKNIPKAKLTLMRHSVYQLLISISKDSFTFNDFKKIISFCCVLETTTLTIEVIQMFKHIVLLNSSPLRAIISKYDATSLLYKFINTRSGAVVGAVFDCFAYMEKTNIISEQDFLKHSVAMLSLIHKECFTYDLFDTVLNIVTDVTSDIFIICCIIALKVGEKACKDLISSISTTKVEIKSHWVPFLLVLFRHMPKDVLNKLAHYVIDCCEGNWISILNSIEIIWLFFGAEKDNFCIIFIKALIETIERKNIQPDDELFDQFVAVVARFLFFRNNPGFNIALLCCLQDNASEFVDIMSLIEFLRANRHYSLSIDEMNFTVREYFNVFKQDYEKQSSLEFGLRFDQTGKWFDEKLAISCVRIIVKSKSTLATMTTELICSFLAARNPELIEEIVPQIVVPPKSQQNLLEVSNFLYYKLLLLNKEDCFTYKPSTSSVGSDAIPCFVNTCNFNLNESISIIKEIRALWDISSALGEKIKKSLEDTDFKSSSAFVDEYKIDLSKRCEHINKLWRHVWGYMTLEKAPWEKAVPCSRHFMRDNTLCFAKCPFKMKPNIDFDDHIVASKARDKMRGKERRNTIKRRESWVKSVTVEIEPPRPTKVLFSTKCTVVKIERETLCTFDMHTNYFSISYTDTHIKSYEYYLVSAVTNQTYLHHHVAIEIFFNNGRSLFVAFQKQEDKAQVIKIFMSKIKTLSLHSLADLPSEKTNQWVEGKISNFEYLMYLNRLSGRTFLNQMQYPIFPWILKDFKSSKLDLNDPNIFRDLTKPVGALYPEKLMAIESTENAFESPDGLYNSAMAYPMMLYVMMVRVEPFTTMHIQMQSGRFDVPDRLFNSIEAMHNNSMKETNDVRELIPEFFFMPEFLLNLNNFDLGFSDDVQVNDVQLPPWAKNAVEFVYLHRKALECDYVSKNINNWIDLIWGYKQKGKEAIKAKNTFPAFLYEDIWTQENLNDPVMRAQIEASKRHLGQIPLQLFTSPHPQRKTEMIEKCAMKSYRLQAATTKLLFATINQEKLDEIAVTFIDREGILSKFYCALSEGDDSSVSTSSIGSEPQVKILDTKDEKVTEFGILPGNIYLTFGDKINIFNANTGVLSLLSESVQCWAISGEWFAVIGLDSMLKVYNARNPTVPHCATPFQHDLARCCCVSPEFHVVVAASRDGGVVVHSLETGFPVRIIDLGVCTPMKVCVTPSWGFIVIYLTRIEENKLVHVLSVYTINGLFVREKILPSPASKMTCWKSPKGFDYIAISTERGTVFTSEVFYLNFGKVFCRFQSKLVALEFNEKMGTVIAVSDDGKIFSEFYSYGKRK